MKISKYNTIVWKNFEHMIKVTQTKKKSKNWATPEEYKMIFIGEQDENI